MFRVDNNPSCSLYFNDTYKVKDFSRNKSYDVYQAYFYKYKDIPQDYKIRSLIQNAENFSATKILKTSKKRTKVLDFIITKEFNLPIKKGFIKYEKAYVIYNDFTDKPVQIYYPYRAKKLGRYINITSIHIPLGLLYCPPSFSILHITKGMKDYFVAKRYNPNTVTILGESLNRHLYNFLISLSDKYRRIIIHSDNDEKGKELKSNIERKNIRVILHNQDLYDLHFIDPLHLKNQLL